MTPERKVAVAVGSAGAALFWIIVNGPVEGPILLVLAPGAGITVADVPSLVVLLGAVALTFSAFRRDVGSTRRDQEVEDTSPEREPERAPGGPDRTSVDEGFLTDEMAGATDEPLLVERMRPRRDGSADLGRHHRRSLAGPDLDGE